MKKSYDAILVEKENIKGLKFPEENIYSSSRELREIDIKLRIAGILGNMEKIKCKIFFEDSEAVKVVETTIWATCEKNIVLKAGIHIPIRRIIDIVI